MYTRRSAHHPTSTLHATYANFVINKVVDMRDSARQAKVVEERECHTSTEFSDQRFAGRISAS